MANRELKIGRENFDGIEEAASFLSRRLSDHWGVASFIGHTLKAELIDEGDGEGLIVLSSDGEEINRFTRNTSLTNTGVGLQTGAMNLIAHIGSYHSSQFLDRGLLWVRAAGDSESSMFIGVNREHGLDEEGIAVQLEGAFSKGDEFVEGLLSGNPNPPYGEDYPEVAAA